MTKSSVTPSSGCADVQAADPEPEPSQFALDVLLEGSCAHLQTDLVQCWCGDALAAQQLLDLSAVSYVEVSVKLLDREAMRQLNHEYRHKDSATNVLSFASDLPVMEGASDTGGFLAIGDLVLCPAIIEAEAAEQDKPLMHHWAHMIIHGTLHLCGYDHENAHDARTMEREEIRILSALGIPDPFLDNPNAASLAANAVNSTLNNHE